MKVDKLVLVEDAVAGEGKLFTRGCEGVVGIEVFENNHPFFYIHYEHRTDMYYGALNFRATKEF